MPMGMRARWHCGVLGAVTAAMVAGTAGLAQANTVTGAAWPAPVTVVHCPWQDLQAAISAAAPGSVLVVAGHCTGTFTVSKDLTLTGTPGAVLDGGQAGTTLTVIGQVRVQVTGLTITGGKAAFIGGGIQNGSGTVILTFSTVSGNTAFYDARGGGGGGIYNDSGTVRLRHSQVFGNASFTGGGILNAGTMTLTGSAVSGNTAYFGGGIANYNTVALHQSQVRGNTSSGQGGGIFNATGEVRLQHSQVLGNTASFNGGGIYNLTSSSTVRLRHSQVLDNTPDNCFPDGSVPGCTS